MLVLFCIVLYFIVCGGLGMYRCSSLFIAPATLILYLLYYEDWIQASCTGECNIRIDIFFSIPTLIAIFWVAFNNLIQLNREKYATMRSEEDTIDSVACDQPINRDKDSVQLSNGPVDYADKYDAKKAIRIVVGIIISIVIYVAFFHFTGIEYVTP